MSSGSRLQVTSLSPPTPVSAFPSRAQHRASALASSFVKLGEVNELEVVKRKLAGVNPRSVQYEMSEARFVESRLRKLSSVLSAEPVVARAEIARHVRKITLSPEGRVFVASGTWNLIGSGCYRGAGGPVCTILPRAKFLVDLAA
jgi:hypothetical protein